jgi:hypothetical protein
VCAAVWFRGEQVKLAVLWERTMRAEARKRIAEAQRKRWAAAKKKVPGKSARKATE